METVEQKKTRVRQIITTLNKAHPDARLALDFSSPMELLVALILAAQARDERVNEVTAVLFKKYRTVASWTRLDESEVSKITFYRNKTKAIHGAAAMLLEKFGGEVPNNLDDLLCLPGVGRKTANIILGNAFGQPAIGVDRHVMRVSERLGLTGQADPDKIEADLTPIVPAANQVKFCHLLQFHGRRICVARLPDCPNCPINLLCFYPDKTPAKPVKPVKK
jgi:endonuclease-3